MCRPKAARAGWGLSGVDYVMDRRGSRGTWKRGSVAAWQVQQTGERPRDYNYLPWLLEGVQAETTPGS
jgi:hypothetical protein